MSLVSQSISIRAMDSDVVVKGIDGEFELVFGTSCSSPVVGSMITLINDARLARGKRPVGKSF